MNATSWAKRVTYGGQIDLVALILTVTVILLLLLALVIYIVYKLLDISQSETSTAGLVKKARNKRRISKSVSIIVKMPSLAKSYGIDLNDEPDILMASQSQTAPAADNNQKLRRVLLIRLPSGDQASSNAEQQPQTQPQQIEQPQQQQPQQQQQQQQQQQNASTNIPPTSQNVNSATTNDNNESHNTTEEPTGKKRRSKEGDSNMYKNYSPKQREWMLVYLSYARGQLGMPFEEKLQESVVQQTNSILAKRGRFCNINRIPSSKTLRTVWKNLWEERTVGSVIRKGGRPRIDPNLKREKRNERERQKRAAAREKREMDKNKEG